MLENSSYFRSRRISGNKYGPIPFRGRPELSSFSTYERRAKGLSTDLRKEGFGITLPLSCREWLKIALSKIPFSPVGGPCRITESDFYSKQGSPCPPWEQEQNMNFSACFGYRTCNEVAVQEYRAIFSSIIFYTQSQKKRNFSSWIFPGARGHCHVTRGHEKSAYGFSCQNDV